MEENNNNEIINNSQIEVINEIQSNNNVKVKRRGRPPKASVVEQLKEDKFIILSYLSKNKKIFQESLKNLKLKHIVISMILMSMTSFFTYFSNNDDYTDNQIKNNLKKYGVSVQQRLDTLKTSHNYYTKVATKEELMVRWIEMFSRCYYKNNGDSKYNEYDCVSAVIRFFWGWGANVVMENIPSIDLRSDRLAALSQLDIRKSFYEVHKGDIIIFNAIDSIYHCGVVYDTCNGYICYMDVNAATKTYGFYREKWGSSRIKKIFYVSYSYWIGDLLRNLDK